jgi:hypothetical protein
MRYCGKKLSGTGRQWKRQKMSGCHQLARWFKTVDKNNLLDFSKYLMITD